MLIFHWQENNPSKNWNYEFQFRISIMCEEYTQISNYVKRCTELKVSKELQHRITMCNNM